ncbi:MAG: 30S ribosomal protein S12 methylthiotransferase RimO, partial [Oscillospiraceae bacterium]
MSKIKVALISLGCPKNLVNSEQMLYLMRESGMELVPEPEDADTVVINTCGFIESAKSEAIDTIIEMGELKKAGKIKSIVAAGCLVQRYKDEILKELPELDAMLGTGSYGDIVEAVKASLKGKPFGKFGDIDAAVEET